MNVTDTAAALAKLAAFDQRTVGDADLAAWHEILGHLRLDACLAAVTAWYRENSSRAMPADIRKLATDIQARQRGATERARRQIVASPTGEPSRTGKAMVSFVLDRLRAAGSDPAAGKRLGRERAVDVAQDACQEWLTLTADMP